jgi:hypothetical protein
MVATAYIRQMQDRLLQEPLLTEAERTGSN